MRKYIKPEMEIELLDCTCDIITASGGDNYADDIFDETPNF